jgi:hypothetical protein
MLQLSSYAFQQEEIDREETLADLRGGQVQEEGLEDLIAAPRATLLTLSLLFYADFRTA